MSEGERKMHGITLSGLRMPVRRQNYYRGSFEIMLDTNYELKN